MSNLRSHHPVEILAWIAGILATLIALVALYFQVWPRSAEQKSAPQDSIQSQQHERQVVVDSIADQLVNFVGAVIGAKTVKVCNDLKHTVVSGEVLLQIAAKYKVSYTELVALNRLKVPVAIDVGQELQIGTVCRILHQK